MATRFDRIHYSLAQTARVAWFAGHYMALRRMTAPIEDRHGERFSPSRAVPPRAEMTKVMREMMEKDWRNIEAGLYAKPHDLGAPNLRRLMEASRRFWRDARKVEDRRRARGHSEVNTDEHKDLYPRYYLQNFHYQTDGWLSEESAKLYDTQVDVLFTGLTDAMRRMALVPLRYALQGRDQRRLNLVDVASGTGRFLTFVKDNYPRLNVSALDLSPDYLEEARRTLNAWHDVDYIHANAEAMPFEDESQDILTSIYLFHELPPKVRRVVAGEIARVLRPGGTFILVDSLQYGDRPSWDGLLESFPHGFHEPYYDGYLSEDLPALFGEVGLDVIHQDTVFLSKCLAFRKSD